MVMITGATGQLGSELMKYPNTIASTFDITDEENVKREILKIKPQCIIHCAAYTSVDKAEDEPTVVERVNAIGTKNIAIACKAIRAKLIYISTDYVFNGTKNTPYLTTDIPNPQNVYGKTKLQGEIFAQNILDELFIVRISWVFGIHGNNFVKTMLKLAGTKAELDIVGDQIGSPTYVADIAPVLYNLSKTQNYGIYHGTNQGSCTWAQFAQEIFKQAGKNIKVNHISTFAYPTKATRPKNSCLGEKKLAHLPPWQDAIARFLKEYANA